MRGARLTFSCFFLCCGGLEALTKPVAVQQCGSSPSRVLPERLAMPRPRSKDNSSGPSDSEDDYAPLRKRGESISCVSSAWFSRPSQALRKVSMERRCDEDSGRPSKRVTLHQARVKQETSESQKRCTFTERAKALLAWKPNAQTQQHRELADSSTSQSQKRGAATVTEHARQRRVLKATQQHGPSEPPLTEAQVRAAAQFQELCNNLPGDEPRKKKKRKKKKEEPGVSTGPLALLAAAMCGDDDSDAESTGGPGVSTGPSEAVKLHFGDNGAQCLSQLLCQMEEGIAEVHGSDYQLKERRRALIMTLPTSQGWQVMTRLLQAGTRYASLQELHDGIEVLVQKRWLCLQADNVT